MKPATEILLSAAFVLTPEENWTQNALARDKSGRAVSTTDESAVSWCVVGAAIAAAVSLGNKVPEEEALRYLDRACGMNRVAFNNRHATHVQLLDALYKAAELSETA